MGCGNSKLNPEGEVVPPRIRPLLRRRFLELRKRRNASNLKDGTLSKKELLKDGEFEEHNSLLVDTKSMYSPDGSTTSSIHTDDKDDHASSNNASSKHNIDESCKHNLEDAQQHDLKIGNTPLPDPDRELNDNEISINLIDINKEDEVIRNAHKKVDDDKLEDELEEANEEEEEEEEGEEEEEEGKADNEGDRCICPGSPSFRVYFVEAMKNDKENVEVETTDAGKQLNMSHQKSRSHESVESDFSGEQESKMIKKGKKGRSFKRAISKRGPVSVKNLLNVKACYHIGCSGHGNDRASLLARKAAA